MSEATLSLAVSHILHSRDSAAVAVESVAITLLEHPGIRAVRIQPKGILFEHLNATLVWGAMPTEAAVSARAAIQWKDRHWGDLHVYFDVLELDAESPARLARFAAQQMAAALARESLEIEREAILSETAEAYRQLAVRKAFHRARGILQERHGITEFAAGELLKKRAAQSGRSVQEAAEVIIAAHPWRGTQQVAIA